MSPHTPTHSPCAYSMRSMAPTLCWLLGISPPAGALPLREVTGALGRCERLALVVIDSLGLAQLKAHSSAAPFLAGCLSCGSMTLFAESPPYTPVNVATMMTGAPFELHGVRKKGDPLRQESIFDLMARCAVKAVIVAEKESVPAHLFPRFVHYPRALLPLPDQNVMLGAMDEVRLGRPDFLWIYYTGFDRACHRHGPAGEDAARSLALIDRGLSDLHPLLRRAGYGIVITADHGHHEVVNGAQGMKGVHDGTSGDDLQVPLMWSR